MSIGDLIAKYGPHIGLLVFFVWWSWVRERKLTERLDKVQDEFIRTLQNVVRENTEAVSSLKDALKDRPCMALEGK